MIPKIPAHEVTEDNFHEMHECLPPIYLSHIDGQRIKFGFAVSEPLTHCEAGAVVSLYWEGEGKFFTAQGILANDEGTPVFYTENAVWGTFLGRTVHVDPAKNYKVSIPQL
jgi:hypothetical protein